MTLDDEYDPLAPVFVGEDPDEPAEESLGGFSDADHIVRVWLDSGRLTKVRVSSVWRSKLAGKSLEGCFAAAFAASRVRVAPDVTEPAQSTPVDTSGVPPFGTPGLRRFQRALSNLDRRWEQVARHAELPRQEPAVGEVDGVRVHLTPDGAPDSVEFDEDWLDDATPGELGDAVVKAAGLARDNWSGPARPDGELARLSRQREVLLAGLSAMVTGDNT